MRRDLWRFACQTKSQNNSKIFVSVLIFVCREGRCKKGQNPRVRKRATGGQREQREPENRCGSKLSRMPWRSWRKSCGCLPTHLRMLSLSHTVRHEQKNIWFLMFRYFVRSMKCRKSRCTALPCETFESARLNYRVIPSNKFVKRLRLNNVSFTIVLAEPAGHTNQIESYRPGGARNIIENISSATRTIASNRICRVCGTTKLNRIVWCRKCKQKLWVQTRHAINMMCAQRQHTHTHTCVRVRVLC